MNLFTIMDDINYVADNFCSTKNVLTVFKICGYLLLILRLCVPIIIIVMGTLKFYNVVTSSSGSQDSFSKELKSLLFRVAIGIFVFFVPTIVHATLYNFISDESKMCEVCLLKPSKCGSSDEDVINRGNTDRNYDNLPTDETNKTCLNKCDPLITVDSTAYQNCMNTCLNPSESTTEENKDPNCTLRNASERYCENKSGCTWDKTNKKCTYSDTADNCEYSCKSKYTEGTTAYLNCIDGCSDKNQWKTCEEIGFINCSKYSDRCRSVTENSMPKCVDINYVTKEEQAAKDYCSLFNESTCSSMGSGNCNWENGACVPVTKKGQADLEDIITIH